MRKGLAVVIGGVLAVVIATAVVITNDCRHNQVQDDCPEDWQHPDSPGPVHVEWLTVTVSTEDIPANQLLDPLVEEGVFTEIQIPHDWFVEGAITDLRQLRGSITTTPILANEQITSARLKQSADGFNV